MSAWALARPLLGPALPAFNYPRLLATFPLRVISPSLISAAFSSDASSDGRRPSAPFLQGGCSATDSRFLRSCGEGPKNRCWSHPRRLQSTDLDTSVNVHEHKLTRPTPKLAPEARTRLQREARGSGSLIPDTLQEMEADVEFKETAADLKKWGQKALTKAERERRQRALTGLGFQDFNEKLKSSTGKPFLKRRKTEILQVNIGLYCNQACSHCHVESSPKRSELMSQEVVDRCLKLLASTPSIHTLDITGGAPELCPGFRPFVQGARALGKHVIDRCNLTSLLEPDQTDTARFLADHEIEVVASLPCYSAKNVNMQRGKGVFAKSIAALTILNDLGYGQPGSGLVLNLVYNPLGGFLPPDQGPLKEKYKEELWREFGIVFNDLFAITNMPIKRFMDFLRRRGEVEDYMELLVRNFNHGTLDNLMCRNLISVGFDGVIYDCDFNQQLALDIKKNKKLLTVFDLDSLEELESVTVQTENHCYGCTAGRGSS